ncbi:MAG: hypothetical protein JJT77_00090 [Crocinitomicaceae bacterium]|nr:hypothetical protein [Crocinitomicaceae bacterium]
MKWFVYITLFTLILPAGYKFGVLLDYSIRYQKYATELCINKDIPEKKCNGKCQLAMNTDASESPNEPIAPSSSQVEIGPLFIPSEKATNLFTILQYHESHNWYYNFTYAFHIVKDIYHPPKHT